MHRRGKNNPKDHRAQARLEARRSRRRLRRMLILERRRTDDSATTSDSSRHQKHMKSLLSYYAKTCSLSSSNTRSKNVVIPFPKTFSFIENPEDTLHTIETFIEHALNDRAIDLAIDHRRCELIDHGAEAVASVLGQAVATVRRKRLSGWYPQDPILQRIVASVGMPSILGLTNPDPGLLVFPLCHGRKGTSLVHTTSAEKATSRLVEYINRCLARYGHTLTVQGRKHHADLVGEVLANAEAHSGRPDWWVAAYLMPNDDGNWGHCHITIFGFGESLAESLKRLPPNARLRRKITDRVRQHTRWFSSRWREDDLWTLYALQGKVSRQNTDRHIIGDRGQGTAEMIQAFHDLSGSRISKPKMCLLSGHTHILFDDRYRMERPAAQSARVIAFNASNSLAKPPDSRYVRHMTRRFPGTLVSLRFILDEEHLSDIST